jgi:hypothetical protein
MSEMTLWNPDKEKDKVGWDLATEELGLDQTCPENGSGTWLRNQISWVN